MDQEVYDAYVAILEEELVCAMGCTEPIAVAYCAALARQTLGAPPERVEVAASANIIKNVKSVVVPNTGGARGIEAAAAAGVVAGNADAKLEVLICRSGCQEARRPQPDRTGPGPLSYGSPRRAHPWACPSRRTTASLTSACWLTHSDAPAGVARVSSSARGRKGCA